MATPFMKGLWKDVLDKQTKEIETKDQTIAVLRAAVERLEKQRDFFQDESVERHAVIIRMDAELTQLREELKELKKQKAVDDAGIRKNG